MLSQDTDEAYIDDNRIRAVTDSVERRIQNLEQVIREHRIQPATSNSFSTEDDVKENIAKDYSHKNVNTNNVIHSIFKKSNRRHDDCFF